MDGDISPRQKSPPIEQAIQSLVSIDNGALGSLDLRADPDAQTTVTDFLDFTEYLPADMMRSLTLIGKLDQTYTTASENIHELTTKWGQLPNLPAEQRSPPVRLRADISRNLTHAVNARTYSHAEAIRMAENVNRHYIRASTILSKLQTMLENYPPPEEQKSPVVTAKSPQLSRAPKFTMRIDGHRVRRANIPRITVPGEVLAPYDLNYELYSGDEDSSSESESDDDLDEDDGSLSTTRATPGPPRIKLVKKGGRPPKAGRTPKSRSAGGLSHYAAGISTSTALAQLQPPPENVVIGSADAPWGQLTQWELARLRKRMKKNAAWAPSDTMIARELKSLGRGVEAFNAAKQKAEEEGNPFDGTLPAPVVDPVTGVEALPPGALTKEALAAEEKNLSNRGMKLNEAKKLKREQLAKQAAEEAEESARKMIEAARAILDAQGQAKKEDASAKTPSKLGKTAKKRKRDSLPEADAESEKPDLTDRSQSKRTKTETPVPPPHPQGSSSATSQSQESTGAQVARTPATSSAIHLSTTPIPLPVHGQEQPGARLAVSPAPSAAGNTVTTTVPLKPPAETPIPPPQHSPKKSTTPILPPSRETRKSGATRKPDPPKDGPPQPPQQQPLTIKPNSRAVTPAPVTPKPEPDSGSLLDSVPNRRPASRGKASSQEPQLSLAADRPRRASTARNTPAPERAEQSSARPVSRRARRPAPGVISRTNSGGSSAVTKRKAAPKKKSKANNNASKKDKGNADSASGGDGDVDVDDEGNVIDPDEPRYCLCNRVSFGTMISCDNNEVSTIIHSVRAVACRGDEC